MRLVVLLLATFGSSAVVEAQSLGDVARREQEKRKDAPAAAAPTYTETDLKSKRAKSKGTVSEMPATGARDVGVKGPPPEAKSDPALDLDASPAPGASPEPDASPAPEPESDRARQEREWRVRFADARTRLAEAQEKAYEERVQVVFVSGVPVQQVVRTPVETPALIAARQALLDLEEELRRSGGLPGWGRP